MALNEFITIDNIKRTLTVMDGTERLVGRDDDGDFKILLQTLINAISGIPSGIIMPYGGTSAPSGYLDCDGSEISRTTYADLFTAIGTTWGVGDGVNTFNVPDLQGAFLRGAGANNTETMADGNPFEGPAVGSFENDQLQGHYHEAYDASGGGALVSTGIQVARTAITIPTTVRTVREAVTDGVNGTPRTGDETRPFAAGIKYIIKI
jgi:microcystin-dependent protein